MKWFDIDHHPDDFDPEGELLEAKMQKEPTSTRTATKLRPEAARLEAQLRRRGRCCCRSRGSR